MSPGFPAEEAMVAREYDKTIDSGVEWLGGVPAHWQLTRLKFECSRWAIYGANEPAESYTTDGVRFLRTTDIDDAGALVDDNAVFLPRESVKEYVLSDGDLIISRSGTLGRALHYRSAIHGRCAYAGYLVRFVPKPTLDSQFVFYFTKSKSFADWLSASAIQSTIGNVNGQKYANLQLALPPYREQQGIAGFLDHETAKIDALVARKERLIELLQEKRTALITHAVTKGLDPNVPMKPSGVEWLGEVPVHWEVMPNRHLFGDVDRRSVTGEEELLTVSHLTGVTRRSEKTVTMIQAESHEGYKICEPDDLVVNTLWGWMGALGVARERGIVSPAYNVYHINDDSLRPRFVEYYCRTPSNVCDITRHSKGVWKSRLRIYPDDFRDVVTPVPPLEEQDEIADRLDEALEEIDRLLATIAQSLTPLAEFRMALISAAVTGKIDVREEVA